MNRFTKNLSVLIVCIVATFLACLPVKSQDLQRYAFDSRHMGTQFNIILYAENETAAYRASEAAFERVEELNQMMSDYIENSELNQLSRKSGSGEWMKISDDLFNVLRASKQISEKTNGLFDVTMGPLTHEWRYIRMMPEPKLPGEKELNRLLNKVGYEYMELDEENKSIRLKIEHMQLDLGGIAKGYSAEEAIKTLKKFGIQSALVDAGGDITLSAPPPGRANWTVSVPKGRSAGDPEMISLHMSDKTVTTSGDMFQFLEIDGQRYSHIINPNTGLGAVNRIQATVISEKGMYADAFASVLTLMEPEVGIELIDGLEGTEAIIFMAQDETIREWSSNGFPEYLKPTY